MARGKARFVQFVERDETIPNQDGGPEVLTEWELAIQAVLRTALNMRLSGGHASFVRKMMKALTRFTPTINASLRGPRKVGLSERQLAAVLRIIKLPKYAAARKKVEAAGDLCIPALGIKELIRRKKAEEKYRECVLLAHEKRAIDSSSSFAPTRAYGDPRRFVWEDPKTVTEVYREKMEKLLKAQEEARLAELAMRSEIAKSERS